MGKTPGKWIKTLLLGKKSSKSSLTKGSEKLRSAKKEELVTLKDDASNLSVDPPVISTPVPATIAQAVAGPGTVAAEKQPSDGVDISSLKENEASDSNINPESRNDSGESEREQAATKVQAVFRGHQARRAFRTLKGIVRVQAMIRGHLVRRQAVATYSCLWGIVKFQALVRGQKARCSDIGVQLQKKNAVGKTPESLQSNSCRWMENPSKLAIVDKLLASSPTALPLKPQYGPEDPNSAWVWLERWTRLQIWASSSLATKCLISIPQTKKRNCRSIETEKGRTKRSIKKPAGPNTENNSNRSMAENEKPKRSIRKASTHATPPSKEHPRIEKAKQNSRKSANSQKEGSSLEIKDEKPRPSLKKASSSSVSDGPEKATRKSSEKKKDSMDAVQKELDGKASTILSDVPEGAAKKDSTDAVQKELEGKASATLSDVPEGAAVESAENKKDIPDAVPKEPDLDKDEKLLVSDKPEKDEQKTAEINDKPEDIQNTEEELCSESVGVDVASENTKATERRASLPAKIDHEDDGPVQSGRKIPSYMAPTESAKARVRGQGSPRLVLERTEKNGTTRRHSLPSSANGKLSTMSPRAHRLLLTSGKGSINSDKSLSSSKDAGDKSIRAEWKR